MIAQGARSAGISPPSGFALERPEFAKDKNVIVYCGPDVAPRSAVRFSETFRTSAASRTGPKAASQWRSGDGFAGSGASVFGTGRKKRKVQYRITTDRLARWVSVKLLEGVQPVSDFASKAAGQRLAGQGKRAIKPLILLALPR